MQKLIRADALIVNGRGLEEFLGAPVEKANARLVVIDSSAGISDALQYAGGGHGHGHAGADRPSEWAGAFQLAAGAYRWSFAKVDGKYADPAMKIVILAAEKAGAEAIEHAEAQAAAILGRDAQPRNAGAELVPADTAGELRFDPDQDVTAFTVRIAKAGTYVVFTEHLPFEFEAGEHFLKDADGNDVEPVAQEPDGEHDHGHAGAHGAGHQHHHTGANPHLFASPRQAARLALNIAAELSKLDPDGAALYLKNGQAYAQRLNALADEFSALGRRLGNNRVVQPHGIMDYLARDMGLKIVAVTQPHGQEPSAAEMLELVEAIRARKAGVVFTEPQYSDKVGRTLAKESGIMTAVFDPAASGPDNAPLDYYETTMRANLKAIETALGRR